MQQQSQTKFSPQLINQLTDECCENIDAVMSELGISYHKSHKRLFGRCPIHGGNNQAAWNLYPEGDEVRGIWVCRSHHCERKWKKNFAGFLHGVLSTQAGKDLPWTVAVQWMLKFLKYDSAASVKVPDASTLARRAQSNAIRRWNIMPKTVQTEWTRERVRSTLTFPAQYFVDRGYGEAVLDKYDVGYYDKQKRVLVPVYDAGYKCVVGFAGRSIYDKCEKCGYWHSEADGCPVTIEAQVNSSKWKNSRGFEAANFLYNYWFAREHILKSATIILVEGPGDVWRLEEAGIHNSVALFGVDLTEEQITLIESAWCMNIIVLLDNDPAGIAGAKEIKKKLCRTHRLYFPTINTKDVGELSIDSVTDDIQPIMDKVLIFQKSIGVT